MMCASREKTMTYFDYLVQDKEKKLYKGSLEAPDRAAVIEKLKQKGLTVVSVHKKNRGFDLFASKVHVEDVVMFSERLSVMVSEGLPLIKSLKTMSNQTENAALKKVIKSILLELEGGRTFSSALAKHPSVFSKLYVSLIKAGEVGGMIDTVLQRISEYLTKDYLLRRDVKKAFTYPLIVLCVSVVVVAFLIIFIVPIFEKTYSSMRLTLPILTLILIQISSIAKRFWWIGALGIFASLFACKTADFSRKVKLFVDSITLKLPLVGIIVRDVEISRFLRTLGLLVESGVTITQSLAIAKEVMRNRRIVRIIDRVEQNVAQGSTISAPLSKEKMISPMILQMIAAGEESSTLDTMLRKTADFLDRETAFRVEKTVARLEPLMTFGLALVVGFIALAVYLPMFELVATMSK